MRQEMVVIGNEWNFGCCAERREFSIVRIFNEDKVVGIDTAGKLSLWPKEISEPILTEGRNSAQNKLGLAPGRFVSDQLKASLPDSREDTLRCASRVEARGYEDIRVDDNPFHSDFIHRKLAKVSRKILTELKPVHLGPQSAWGRFCNRPERRATNRDPGRVYTNGPARHSISRLCPVRRHRPT
jgi:hypothetical protein